MIELLEYFGDDLMVANCARVSLHKKHDIFDESDIRLIHYLARHNHISPFFHPIVQFLVHVPIFVARQWTRSVIGTKRTVDEIAEIGFDVLREPDGPVAIDKPTYEPDDPAAMNEVSRRYVDTEPEFFEFSQFRMRPEKNIKQGSGGVAPSNVQMECRARMRVAEQECLHAYRHLLELGIAPEQARAVLPQTMITSWIETGSLAYWSRFCKLRTALDAQQEIREIAQNIDRVMERLFPVSWVALKYSTTQHENDQKATT